MAITFASLFTGGGGADLGAIAAGLTPLLGIEKDPDIAEVGQLNANKTIYGITKKVDRENPLICDAFPVTVRDITKLHQNWWEGLVKHNRVPDWLHASPPCVRASTANNGKETQEDWELSEAICRAIAILKPKYFSLENVAGYKNFKCFLFIEKRLLELGYAYDHKVLDCSEYGVPQSRKRLFLVASERNFRSTFFFWERLKKQEPIGWKEAIADLIPSLEETTLTNWQIQAVDNCDRVWKETSRLNRSNPPHFIQVANYLIQRSGARKKNSIPNNTIRLENEPMFTLKSMSGTVRPSVHQATIVVNGQPLQPDIRCYARWQTFPDSYQWSDDFKLNVKICGNAVPPLMMKQVIEAVLND